MLLLDSVLQKQVNINGFESPNTEFIVHTRNQIVNND